MKASYLLLAALVAASLGQGELTSCVRGARGVASR